MKQIKNALLTLLISIALTGCQSDNDVVTPPNPNNPLIDSMIVDDAMNDFIANNEVVGLSVATIKITDGKTVTWSSQYGLKDVETQAPVDSETSFWVGSVSKAVMGTAIMIANEDSLLQLDTDIHKVLNDNASFSLDNPGRQAISINQLASHTSGIIDNEDFYACAYYLPEDDGSHEKLFNLVDPGACPAQSPITLDGFLGAYLDSSGEFYNEQTNFLPGAPGDEDDYSNIGAALAGYVLSLHVGQDLDAYASQEIFNLLGMQNTSWKRENLTLTNIATPYANIDDELMPIPVYELATWPDGGLRSNATDLAKLLSVVINNGTEQSSGLEILTAESVAALLPTEESEEGLFWQTEGPLVVEGENRMLKGHTGDDPGALSIMVFDPISKLGVIAIANGESENIEDDVFKALVEALFIAAEAME